MLLADMRAVLVQHRVTSLSKLDYLLHWHLP